MTQSSVRIKLAAGWSVDTGLLRKSMFTKAFDAKLCTTSPCYKLMLVHDMM